MPNPAKGQFEQAALKRTALGSPFWWADYWRTALVAIAYGVIIWLLLDENSRYVIWAQLSFTFLVALTLAHDTHRMLGRRLEAIVRLLEKQTPDEP